MKNNLRKNKILFIFKSASDKLLSLWMSSRPERFSATEEGLASWKEDVEGYLGIKDEEKMEKILSGEISLDLLGPTKSWTILSSLFPMGEDIRMAWRARDNISIDSFLSWIKSKNISNSKIILSKILEENKSITRSSVTPTSSSGTSSTRSGGSSSGSVTNKPAKSLGNDKLSLIKEVEPAIAKISKKYNIPEDIIFAQWALESAYGTKHIGGYNYFGMKGVGTAGSTEAKTHEEYQSGNVTGEVAKFKKFNNPEEGFDAYGRLLSESKNFRYATEAFKDSPGKFAIWIWGNSYATSSRYPISLAATAKSIGATLGRSDIGWDYTPDELKLIETMIPLDPGKPRREVVIRELGPNASNRIA
jgi:hypothetical protein